MKTLLITYLPSGENSNTKKILDAFLAELRAKNQTDIETLNLLKASVPIFDEKSISCYYKRNFNGQTLSPEESSLLAKNDDLIKQLKSASIVVIACPMHNFGFPALVKAYIDSVTFFNETFAYDKKMMQGKKVLTIYSSGGLYPNDKFDTEYPNWNSLSLLAHATFNLMGFDEVKTLGTSLRGDEGIKNNLPKISLELKNLVDRWYN